MRKEFNITICLNDEELTPVIIDSHFLKNHSDMNYETIISLVRKLEGKFIVPEKTDGEWTYYRIEPIYFELNPYRLILVTKEGYSFLGVVNAFRVSRKRYNE